MFPRAAILFVLMATGCVKHLPPAPTPDAVVPKVDAAAPPAEGLGRLVVDVVDGPTPVQRVDMRADAIGAGVGGVGVRFTEAPRQLCQASPCVADLPPGSLLLGFPVIGKPGRIETELVYVGANASVYRRSLSVYEDKSGGLRVLGIVMTAVGAAGLATGAALLPIGLAKDMDGMTTAGGISLGVGAVVMTLGILAVRKDAPTYRPGSSNHFPM